MKFNFSHKLQVIIDQLCQGNRAELGRRTGANNESIRQYLLGREPGIGFIIKLHKEFRISYEWMLNDGNADLDTVERRSRITELESQLRDKERIIQLLEADRHMT